MSMSGKYSRVAIGAIAMAAMLISSASAQDTAASYPSQVVRIIVPFSAGSMTDLLARVLSDKLGTMWKQSVIVENHPGIAGTALAARAQPDGYTLLLVSNGHTTIKTINPDVPFDPVKDFAGVSKLASIPMIIIAPPKAEYSSLANLVRILKSKQSGASYASAGLNSTAYIASELFKKTAKLDTVHIPYKGTPDAQVSIMRGDTDFFFSPAMVSDDLIKTGKVKALAVTGSTRIPSLPDVPTFAEAGMPEFQYDAWFGLLAPANTSKDILDKINGDIAKVKAMPDVRERLAKQGAIVVSSTPAQFDATLRSDTELYSNMLKK
jgi:tripartite-type tricarboxylate transporter receptor subunit TctC